jgi:hypothetical protein
MADLPPNPNAPIGGTPPPKKETGKVQPKKETVRINLPPKPSAAPTIKLPTLPPGGPTGAPSAQVSPSAAAPMALAAAPRPTAAAPAAPATSAKPNAPVQPRPMMATAAPIVPALKGLDKGLIYTATVCSLAAVGIVVWVYMTLQNTVTNFSS